MEIDDILSRVAQEEESAIVQSDPLIYYQGYDDESILKLAEQHYEAYAANIHVNILWHYVCLIIGVINQAIMDSYGIKSEGELFSGHFISLRNRLSDKDSDGMFLFLMTNNYYLWYIVVFIIDMSFFNTTHAIEQRLFAVFAKFRRQFFETASALGKRDGEMRQTYEDVTTPIHRYGAKCSGTKEVNYQYSVIIG
jgi:hypothetical protein